MFIIAVSETGNGIFSGRNGTDIICHLGVQIRLRHTANGMVCKFRDPKIYFVFLEFLFSR